MLFGKVDFLLPPGNQCFDGIATAERCCHEYMRDQSSCWQRLHDLDLYDGCCNAEALGQAAEVDRRWAQIANERAGARAHGSFAAPLLACLSQDDSLSNTLRMFMMQSAPLHARDLVETRLYADWRLSHRWGTLAPRPGQCDRDAKSEDPNKVVIGIFEKLLDTLGPAQMTRWVVNLGAGSSTDPMYALDKYNFSGVFVDPMGPSAELKLGRKFRFVRAAADPENLRSIFRRGGLSSPRPGHAPPTPIDFLKVDVDSCDCVLTAAALKLLRPKVILIEINFAVPPPIRFARQCHSDWRRVWHRWLYGGRPLVTHGCSLSEAVMMLGRFGYSLYRISESVNAVFVQDGEIASSLGGAGIDEIACYNEDLGASYLGLVHWSWIEEWRNARPQHVLEAIWCNFTLHDWLLGVSHIPFSLAV